MLSNLLSSFTSQVIPPTAVNGKSCLSLHSHKKDYRSLTFCDSSETSVSQSVRPLTWIRPNINWSPPHFQVSASGFECCQYCDYHSMVPSVTLRNDACLFPLAGHEATGSLCATMSNTQSYCPHIRQALVTLNSAEGSCPGKQLTHSGRETLALSSGPVGLSGFPDLQSAGPKKQRMTQPAPLAFLM